MSWPGAKSSSASGWKRRAVAGGRLAVVVGIGTNVVGAPEGTPTPATSLAALGIHVGAEELFARAVGHLGDSGHLEQWPRVR